LTTFPFLRGDKTKNVSKVQGQSELAIEDHNLLILVGVVSAYTKSQTGANRAFPDFSFVKSLHISFSQHIHYCYNFY